MSLFVVHAASNFLLIFDYHLCRKQDGMWICHQSINEGLAYCDLWVSCTEHTAIVDVSRAHDHEVIINDHEFAVHVDDLCYWLTIHICMLSQSKELDVLWRVGNFRMTAKIFENRAATSADRRVFPMQLTLHHRWSRIVHFARKTLAREEGGMSGQHQARGEGSLSLLVAGAWWQQLWSSRQIQQLSWFARWALTLWGSWPCYQQMMRWRTSSQCRWSASRM